MTKTAVATFSNPLSGLMVVNARIANATSLICLKVLQFVPELMNVLDANDNLQ
jgi:hypothetical protein